MNLFFQCPKKKEFVYSDFFFVDISERKTEGKYILALLKF